MTEEINYRNNKAIATWLIIGLFWVIIQILLGGITRLTGSGLSITEWKPILGAIPPMNAAKWQEAFYLYKQKTAQYAVLNNHFTLSDFKAIYFWEWLHREWARALGIVFIAGFLWFLLKKQFSRWMITPLVILFCLGGLQGLVGWLMVSTGLNDTNIYVSHIALAIHFISALILLVYILWFILLLLYPGTKNQFSKQIDSDRGKLKVFAVSIISILTLQLIYGAFMAGLKAAVAAPTWPSINGSFVPPYFLQQSLISHPLDVQFIHRVLAYLLVIVISIFSSSLYKYVKLHNNTLLAKLWYWPLMFVFLQASLGIITVLTATQIKYHVFGTFEYLALAHQTVAIIFLMSMVINLYTLTANETVQQTISKQ